MQEWDEAKINLGVERGLGLRTIMRTWRKRLEKIRAKR